MTAAIGPIAAHSGILDPEEVIRVPDTGPGLSTAAPRPPCPAPTNSSRACASAIALPAAYPAAYTPDVGEMPHPTPGIGGTDAPMTTNRSTPTSFAHFAGVTFVSPLSRTISSWLRFGNGSRPTDVMTASAPRMCSLYDDGSSASPRSHVTDDAQGSSRRCAGASPPRVTHCTRRPRLAASRAIAEPTKPVPPKIMSLLAALDAAMVKPIRTHSCALTSALLGWGGDVDGAHCEPRVVDPLADLARISVTPAFTSLSFATPVHSPWPRSPCRCRSRPRARASSRRVSPAPPLAAVRAS